MLLSIWEQMQNILNSSIEMFLIFHQNMSLNILLSFVLVKKNIVLCDFLCGLCEDIYHLKLNYNLVSWCWIQNVVMLSFVLSCGHSLIARFTNIRFFCQSVSLSQYVVLSVRPSACLLQPNQSAAYIYVDIWWPTYV